jgi:hypothetical protein
MRLLFPLALCFVELAVFLGKWLFIVAAPVLLIVAASYYQADKSCLEPIAGLGLVSGVFAVTHWLRSKVDWLQAHALRNNREETKVTVGQALGEEELWHQTVEEGSRKQAREKAEARRNSRRRMELWKQSNPWGGYNPYE